MKSLNVALTAVAAALVLAPRAQTQETTKLASGSAVQTSAETAVVALPESVAIDTAKKIARTKKTPTVSFLGMAPSIEIQNYRPEDKRGINIFEAPKNDPVE